MREKSRAQWRSIIKDKFKENCVFVKMISRSVFLQVFSQAWGGFIYKHTDVLGIHFVTYWKPKLALPLKLVFGL